MNYKGMMMMIDDDYYRLTYQRTLLRHLVIILQSHTSLMCVEDPFLQIRSPTYG